MLEVYLHAGLGTLALEIQDDAITKSTVAHASAQLDSRRGRFGRRLPEAASGGGGRLAETADHRARHLDARPHLFEQFLREGVP